MAGKAGKGEGNTAQELKGTVFDLEKYGANNTQTPNVDLGRIRVPGPNGTFIEGQGEAMPGYEMQAPQYKIPSQYLNLPQTQGQPSQIPQQFQGYGQQGQQPDVGAIRGFINALTGQPQPRGIEDVSQGRRTAYYAGGVIPNIVMSKLGQPSSAEASIQQEQLTKAKEPTALAGDLKGAMTSLKQKGDTKENREKIFNTLISQYGVEYTYQLRKFLFPEEENVFAKYGL